MFFVRSLLCAGIRLVTCVIEEHTVVSACDDIISGNKKHLSKCKKFLEVTVANACYNIVSYLKVNF